MTINDVFRECLDTMDVRMARKLWAETNPHLYQPADDNETLIMLHRARTEASSMSLAQRLYSHAWLLERNLPSGLPDELKPPAEPRKKIVSGVGIIVVATNQDDPYSRALAKAIEQAQSDAVNDAYSFGKTDPEFVKARMAEARVH